MEHRKESHVSAQPFGIGGDHEERFAHGAKQKVIDQFRVLKGERRKLVGECEDDVAVGDGQ
jgi:hypothetical protein